jgi:hypothetical protein
MTTRIVAAISYYDEQPEWLHRAASSALQLCDHVVALDGRYRRFAGERLHAPADERKALADAGPNVTTYIGSPIEYPDQSTKRTHLLQLASREAGTGGVVLVLDADEELGCEAEHARYLIDSEPDALVWTVTVQTQEPPVYTRADRLLQRSDYVRRSGPQHRRLFRAHPELHMAPGTHSVVVTRHPITERFVALKGTRSLHPMVEGRRIGSVAQHVRIHHHTLERPLQRREAKAAYYDERKVHGEDA